MIVALWAINGLGLGHTARIRALAEEFVLLGCQVRIAVEHDIQAKYIRHAVGSGVSIATVPRPWKAPDHERAHLRDSLRAFLANADVVIADMASVPPPDEFEPLLPQGVCPVFLLRWMTKTFWRERVAPRLTAYTQAHIVVVQPCSLQHPALSLGAPHTKCTIWFAPGFLVARPPTNATPSATPAVAFTCGACGTHSLRGHSELAVAIRGLVAAREHVPSTIPFDAWTGSDSGLRFLAEDSGIFRRVITLDDYIVPEWNQYSVVVCRPSFNTFLEVLQTDAWIVTSTFESDGEWTEATVATFRPLGITILPIMSVVAFRDAVIQAINRNKDALEHIGKRRAILQRANHEVAVYCLSL